MTCTSFTVDFAPAANDAGPTLEQDIAWLGSQVDRVLYRVAEADDHDLAELELIGRRLRDAVVLAKEFADAAQ